MELHTDEHVANQEPYCALLEHMTSRRIWPIDLYSDKQ